MKNEKETITIPKRDYIKSAVEITLVEYSYMCGCKRARR